jgi:hypothetical protein
MVDLGTAAPRWATEADDGALRRLAQRVSIRGPVSYCLEREPEFFALSRLQGDGARVAVIDGAAGELCAMAMFAPDRLRLFRSLQSIPYAGDLKVDPAFRAAGLAGRLYKFLAREALREKLDLFTSLVLHGNQFMAPIVENQAAAVRYHRVATLANFTVFFGPRKRAPGGVTVRSARDGDLAAMVELWNRLQADRELSPVWDEHGLRRRIDRTPGLSLADYLIAERDGRMVAMAAIWDARAIKQVRLIALSTSLGWVRRLYNPIAAGLGRPRIPLDGALLPFFYVAQPCAETAADLRAILIEVHNHRRSGGHVYFDLALDTLDPLLPALDGFWKSRIDFDLYLLDLVGRFTTPPDFAGRSAYFDMALV